MTTTIALDQAARAFHALSEPTRLRIIDLLRRGERCVCDLTEVLETGQSRLSFHLRALKDAGLVKDRRDGRWVYYSLDEGAVQRLSEVLTACCAAGPRWLKGGCCG